jgi:transcriptional regulator GlxA family with amidase domain
MANKMRKEDIQGRRLSKRRIVVVVAPPVEELDLVGPMQVLSAANRLSGKKVYSIEIVTNAKDLTVEGEGGVLSFLAQGQLQDVKGKIDSALLVVALRRGLPVTRLYRHG